MLTEFQKERIICLCRASRKAQGITQKQLADQSAFSNVALSAFENGKYIEDIADMYFWTVLREPERDTFNRIKECNNGY